MNNTYYTNRVRFGIHCVFKFPYIRAKHKNIKSIFVYNNFKTAK